MAEPVAPAPPEATKRGFLAPRPGSHPVDHCARCGQETTAGVGLCDQHNPRHIAAPSATQMHATVLGGIAIGLIGLFFVFSLAVGTTGPYEAEIISSQAAPAGAVALVFTVLNAGDSDGVADCRVTRDGIPRPDDLAFRTPRVLAGQSVSIEQLTPARSGGSVGYVPGEVTVVCT